MRPSFVRSNTAPQASSSRTRSGASFAWSSAMRQLFTYWPPRIVSAKCTFQLSRSSTLASAAAMPPSAMTVCALPRSDLQTRPTDTPAAEGSMGGRRAAPPAPITRTYSPGGSDCRRRPCPAGADHQHVVPVRLVLGHLQEPRVVPDAHREQPDVHVGE